VLKVENDWLIAYPQLGVVTGPGYFRTVDFLVGVSRGQLWLDVEVDNYSHIGRQAEDALRTQQIQLVRVSIPSGELQRPDFVDRF